MEPGNRQYREQQHVFLDSNSQGKASKVDSGGTLANLLRNSNNLNGLQGQQQQANYLQLANNNHALAKRNSLMMTKIAKLEKKISHLQAENMNLKRNNISDSQLRKSLLNDRLTIIEDIVNEKFSDILAAFTTTRQQEGLPFRQLEISSKSMNNGVGDNSTSRQPEDHEPSKSGSSSLSSSQTSSEMPDNPNDSNTDINKNIEKQQSDKKLSEKKRRSLRRQSIYISKESLQNTNHATGKNLQNLSNQTDNYSLMENYGSTGIDSSSDSLGVNYGSHITPPNDRTFKHTNISNGNQGGKADDNLRKHDIEIYNDYAGSNIHELTPSSPSSDESDSRIHVVELPDQSNIASIHRINDKYLQAQELIYQEQMKYKKYQSSIQEKSPDSDFPKSAVMREPFNDDSLDKFSQIYNVSQSSMILQDNTTKVKVNKDFENNENIDERPDFNNFISKAQFKSESTEYEPLNIEYEDIVIVKNENQEVNHSRIKSKSDSKNNSQLIQKSDSSKRRTRGKSVNYALPSLKTKMRRPSKENEIIEVKKSKRKSLTSNNVKLAKKNRQPLKLLSNNT